MADILDTTADGTVPTPNKTDITNYMAGYRTKYITDQNNAVRHRDFRVLYDSSRDLRNNKGGPNNPEELFSITIKNVGKITWYDQSNLNATHNGLYLYMFCNNKYITTDDLGASALFNYTLWFTDP